MGAGQALRAATLYPVHRLRTDRSRTSSLNRRSDVAANPAQTAQPPTAFRKGAGLVRWQRRKVRTPAGGRQTSKAYELLTTATANPVRRPKGQNVRATLKSLIPPLLSPPQTDWEAETPAGLREPGRPSCTALLAPEGRRIVRIAHERGCWTVPANLTR